MELLSRLAKNPFGQPTLSGENRFQPIVDRDNEIFLKVLSVELKERQIIDDILLQLKSIKTSQGSIRFWVKDDNGKKELEVKIEPSKLMEFLEKESKKIENTLKHFVDSVKSNKKHYITYALVAGLLLISIVATSVAVGSLDGAKLLIAASITIVCTIAELFGSYQTLSEIVKHLARRTGVHLTQI